MKSTIDHTRRLLSGSIGLVVVPVVIKGHWLPAPGEPFYMVMRLYAPEAEALEGVWTPPSRNPR